MHRSKQRKRKYVRTGNEVANLNKKPTNAENAVFLCRKSLKFGVICDIITLNNIMHSL